MLAAGDFTEPPDCSPGSGVLLSERAVTVLITLAGLLFCAGFLLVLKNHYYHYDDAFITYTFSRNLAEGHGFVFHPDFSPVQGSSSFFYTILVAAISGVSSIDAHVVGGVLSPLCFCFMIAAVATLATRDLPNGRTGARLALFSLGLTFQAPLALSFGMETCLATGLLLFALLYMLAGRNSPAALCLLMIPLTRLDYLFYFPALGILALVFRNSVPATFRLFAPASVVTACYLIFARFYFGEYVPHTWIAKAYFPPTVSGVISWISLFDRYPSLLVFIIIGSCVILYALVSRGRSKPLAPLLTRGHTGWALLLLTITSFLYTLVLRWKGAPMMPWYFVTTLVLFFALMCRALAVATIRPVILAVLVLAVSGLGAYGGKKITSHYHRGMLNKLGHHDRREKIGMFLRDNFSSIDRRTVLCYEIGKIAYYSRAAVYDVLGLVTPEAISGLKAKDPAITLKSLSPDFVVGTMRPDYFPMMFLSSVYFARNYSSLKEIDRYLIWRRNDGFPD